MRVLPLAVLAAALLAVPAATALQEDPFQLSINPLLHGVDGWERTGPDKAFTWNAEEGFLAFKGQSGKEPPHLLYRKVAWEALSASMQVKSGTRKLVVLLQPESGGDPVRLEIPRNAVRSGKWGEVLVSVAGGKAELRTVDGTAEKVVAEAPAPAGVRWRFGFEAPPGADGAVSTVKLLRRYEDGPQFREEGFESLFDGTTFGDWAPMTPEMEPAFRVEKGLLVGELRTEGGAYLVPRRAVEGDWELRMRALWATDCLILRAVEVPGRDGQINMFESIQVDLKDNLETDEMNDLWIRRAGGRCVITVNGKRILDEEVKKGAPNTLPVLIVTTGKRFFLRDIRLRALPAGGEGDAPGK